ncbi:MAG TPA: hydroxymethylbilane synthase [Candidatus Acidoferrales bacterium]|nr:hydroxymethylbilane synthase [Candidatus Acidoferrales bacterium]
MKALRIGTRGSALALWQARSVARALLETTQAEPEIIIVKTSGDKFQNVSFSAMGTKGVFIKELEDALLEERIDLAVHSMKDVPTEMPEGLAIAAIGKREDVRDALLSQSGAKLASLPEGARVGTSSLRRQSQLLHARRDLRLLELRGNVDTRIEKLRRGDYDAIVLAKAGLDRLALSANISEVLPPQVSLPAAGQGAIGIEARGNDSATLQALATLDDTETRSAVAAERAALAALGGGCQVPIGAWGRLEGGELVLDVAVLSPDGTQRLWEKDSGSPQAPEALGKRIGEKLLAGGAAALLEIESRRTRA